MLRAIAAVAAVSLLPAQAIAQEGPAPPGLLRVPTQIDAGALPLYDGPAPGSEASRATEVWTLMGTERWARNVTQPTLLPVLPEPEKATGAAVIVVPGGGFQFVSMDNEGYPIAQWLADQGVAAFVLKYRVMETPDDEAEFDAFLQRLFAPKLGEERVDIRPGVPFAVADAQAALQIVADRADDWGVDPDRVGMIGFSAGAITTLETVLAEGEAPRPDFIGFIYGRMTAVDVPEDAPPLFAALAADDPLFGAQGFGLVEAWHSAGRSAELHVYASGGHGFGSYKRGVTADAWFDQFLLWMRAQGLLDPKTLE